MQSSEITTSAAYPLPHAVAMSRTLRVCMLVSLVYACCINMLFLHAALRNPVHPAAPVQLPETRRPAPPCVAGGRHAVLILAPAEPHPRSNDPSEAVRVLAGAKRFLRRLPHGAAFLAVTAETYAPSHEVWCRRLHSETAGRVPCKLLIADNATAAAGMAALQADVPCLEAALVIEDALAVDGALLARLAAVSVGHYACLAPAAPAPQCPVYVTPVG